MGDLQFVPGRRRLGLTKHPLPYSHLHDLRIYEPPLSSDEDQLEDHDDVLPDESPTPEGPLTSTALPHSNHNKNRSSSPLTRDSSLNTELYVHPSNIPASTFSSAGRAPTHRFGQQTSPKRRKDDAGENGDEELFGFAQQGKKSKIDYAKRSSTHSIHTSKPSPKKSKTLENPTVVPDGGKKSNRTFQKPDHDSLLSQGKYYIVIWAIHIAHRCTVESIKQKETQPKRFRAPPKIENTPRSARASKRLSRGDQDESATGFKVPLVLPSPNSTRVKQARGPDFMVPPVLAGDVETPRITRSRTSNKGSNPTVSSNRLHTRNTKDLLESTKVKLDLSEQPQGVPNSSITASSILSNSNDASSSLSSPISSAPSSPEFDQFSQNISFRSPGLDTSTQDLFFQTPQVPTYCEPSSAKCPICNETVDRSFLVEFDSGAQRLTVRQQTQFCKAHRTRSARSEWEDKGYPKIDWTRFEERLAKFHATLKDILRGKRPSFYRNSYEDKLNARQNRTVQESLTSGTGMEGLEPGYYGSRGAKIMYVSILRLAHSHTHTLSLSLFTSFQCRLRTLLLTKALLGWKTSPRILRRSSAALRHPTN